MNEEKGFFYNLIEKRFIVLILATFIFIFGAISYSNLPKQEYPLVPMPMVIITAVYPGASAEEIEEIITKKIEDVVMEADGFSYSFSQSYNSVSVVTVNFEMGMATSDLEKSISNLRYKINDLEAELPSGAVVNYTTDTSETAGLILAFTGENQSNAELVQRAEELKKILQGMSGVKKVEIDGEPQQEISITVDMSQLNRMNISLMELSSIISYQNSLIPGGNLVFESDKITVNSSGKLQSLEEIGNIIIDISPESGAIIQLKDIATIEKIPNEDSKVYTYNGQDTILINLYYRDGINVVTAGDEIINEVNKFKSNLPEGIELNTVVNLANDVDKSVSNFTNSVIQALVIVIIVIALGMNLRNALIVTVAIPLSLVITFLVMYVTKIDIHFVSLASLIIVLGTLIDNVIVVCDSIQVRIDNGEDKTSACANGTKSVVSPVLSATLTSASIYIMFYTLPGTMKTFAWSLPTIVISALLASYAVSLLVTPIMCYLFMEKSKDSNKGRINIIDKIGEFVGKVLIVAFEHKKLTLLTAVSILVISLVLLSTLDLEFIPKAEKNEIDISITTTNLNDIRKTQEALDNVIKVISEQPETTYYMSAVGGGVPKYSFSSIPQADSVNKGGVIVGFDLSAGNRFQETAVFVEYLQNEIDKAVPGTRVQVKEQGIMPEVSEPIQIRVVGDNTYNLNLVADIIKEEMEKIDGMTNIYSNREIKTHNYYVDIKNNSLNSTGLTKAEMQLELNTALMGNNASIFRENTKEYPIIVTSNIQTLEDLENLMIKSSATGSKHQIRQISDIKLQEEYSYITRYNGQRSIAVTASPKVGYSSITLQRELQKVLNTKDFEDVYLIYEGELKDMLEALGGMAIGAGIGLVGITLVLFIQFYSFRKTLIVLSAIPFSFVGASLGLVIFKPGLSLFTILGILSLMGIVVTNAIVLVDCIDKERKDGVPINEACKSASSKRFRPIFLSTVTTVLGMLPLAMGGNVLFRGLAIAFMCGAALSMFFTLIIVPIVYDTLEGSTQNNKKV